MARSCLRTLVLYCVCLDTPWKRGATVCTLKYHMSFRNEWLCDVKMVSQLPTGHVKRPMVGLERQRVKRCFGERLLQAPSFSYGVLDVTSLSSLLTTLIDFPSVYTRKRLN